MRMLKLVSIAVAVIWLSATPARAEGAPWCVRYGTGLEGANCGFYSFEQCMQTVRGIGGFCSQNPFEAYGYQQPRQQRPARRSWSRD
jgi:Protein of unknown function (DUF3551)